MKHLQADLSTYSNSYQVTETPRTSYNITYYRFTWGIVSEHTTSISTYSKLKAGLGTPLEKAIEKQISGDLGFFLYRNFITTDKYEAYLLLFLDNPDAKKSLPKLYQEVSDRYPEYFI